MLVSNSDGAGASEVPVVMAVIVEIDTTPARSWFRCAIIGPSGTS